ncbi:MAG: serine acetyltransferase [Cyclobacteriaceae bacterium]|nr:serine acetyltransferase [Cyclobacteriaceae bacterium]
MDKKFIDGLFLKHKTADAIPSRTAICKFTEGLLEFLFPQLSEKHYKSSAELEIIADKLFTELKGIFVSIDDRLEKKPEDTAHLFMDRVPDIYVRMMDDAQAIHDGDPAAQSVDQVIRTYPGFVAIACYRIGNAFCQLGIPLLPRILTEYAHSRTGIDIHPKAEIGTHFCIDHGTGVVIGETTVIGNNVKLYQGVTLGALSVKKEMAKIKRHPTIEDNVIIYAGATILGGNTIIGKNSIIGGNVWITESIPPNSRVYHKPQIEVKNSINIE